LRKGQLLAKEKLSWKSILYVDAKPKLMVHVETWKDRISVLIYSVFVLVTRLWGVPLDFFQAKQLCTLYPCACCFTLSCDPIYVGDTKCGIFATAISQRFV
jgi:hypothetical protein